MSSGENKKVNFGFGWTKKWNQKKTKNNGSRWLDGKGLTRVPWLATRLDPCEVKKKWIVCYLVAFEEGCWCCQGGRADWVLLPILLLVLLTVGNGQARDGQHHKQELLASEHHRLGSTENGEKVAKSCGRLLLGLLVANSCQSGGGVCRWNKWKAN